MKVEPIAHPVIAEILEQDPTLLRLGSDYLWRAHPMVAEPFGDVKKRFGIFLWRRCMHQHRASAIWLAQTKVTPKRGIARYRIDSGIAPPSIGEKFVQPVGKFAHGSRPTQSVHGFAIATRPRSAVSSVIERQAASWSKPPA